MLLTSTKVTIDLKNIVTNIRASKNISGLVKVTVTSPAGLMKFFLNVEPCKVNKSLSMNIYFLIAGVENNYSFRKSERL